MADTLNPYRGQYIGVDLNNSFLVEVDWRGREEPDEEVTVYSWIQMHKEENPFDYYTNAMMQYNKTIYNIDSQCYNDLLFPNSIASKRFNE